MNRSETLAKELRSVDFKPDFSEAVLSLNDGTRLCFCHRVGERWATAVGPAGREQEGGAAGELLASIGMFRLNRKHLDIQFDDGSRWDEVLQDLINPPSVPPRNSSPDFS